LSGMTGMRRAAIAGRTISVVNQGNSVTIPRP
jgi:hypothetical protein